MRRGRTAAIVLLVALAAATRVVAAELPVRRIATLLDGPSAELEAHLDEYRSEILALTAGEFDVRFEPAHQSIGDWTAAGVEAEARRLLADPQVDAIVALGIFASQLFCCVADLPKPVVAAVVLDADVQGFPVVDGHSGVHNLSFLAMPRTLERDLEALRRVVRVERLVVLSDAVFEGYSPSLQGPLVSGFAAQGIEARFRFVGDSIAATVESIPPDTDAVYVYPVFRLANEARRELFEALARRGLPTFSWIGREEVERGALVGLGTDDYHPRLSRRVALTVQRILLGEPPEDLPVRFDLRSRLALNLDTARLAGVSPTWDVMLEAELVGALEPEGVESYTLDSAVGRAVASNLDLEASRLGLAAGAFAPRRARAALWPQLELGALGVAIDEDRASSILSPVAERSLSASIELRQALWSEPLHANVEIQRALQAARESELDELRQDIGQAAAAAYLGVLRARTFERIRRENLALSRNNQDLARVRLEIGSGIEAEVIRWESRIATDLSELVEAHAQRATAELSLARVLHRPLGSPLDLAEEDLLTTGLAETEKRLLALAGTPERFGRLRELLVRDGLARAPELDRLDRLADAKRREALSARRAYWSPTLGLSVELERLLDEGGAGSGTPGLFAGLDLPKVDDTDRTIALRLSLPLFEGGERPLRVAQAGTELDQLRTAREAAGERIEQRIQTALIRTNASFQGIRLSRDAADAATRNFELVQDAYARGALSILDLLDAQSAALVADLAASDAVFRFLVDKFELERAIGLVGALESPAARLGWLDGLERSLARKEKP